MFKFTAEAKMSPTLRRTRSMSTCSSDDLTGARPLQMRRFDDTALSVSPSVLSEYSDISARYPGQRRRVNPASLESRLGPELVKELESLLTPGSTEMPSFAARQAIQKKYNIDRRHIYDWYHTKGLRVSNERKEALGLRAFEPEGKVLRPRIQQQRVIKQRPPQIRLPVYSSAVDSSLAPDCSTSSSSTPSTPAMPLTPSTTYSLPSFEAGVPPSSFPIQYFFDEPFGFSSIAQNADHSAPNAPAFSQGERTSNWVIMNQDGNAQDISDSGQNSPEFPVEPEPVCTAPYEQALPQNQREAYYQNLANVLGPANGVQESVGSYRTFMTNQVQTYYERLLPGDASSSRHSLISAHAPVPVSTSMHQGSVLRRDGVNTFSFAKLDLQDTEYSKWLLYGGRSVASAPLQHLGVPSSLPWLWTAPQGEADASESSLDISEILESPVLRSRCPTAADVGTAATSTPAPPAATLNDLLQRAQNAVLRVSPSKDSALLSSSARSDSRTSQSSSPAPSSSQSEPKVQSLDLRTAKEPRGLDKAMAAKSKERRARIRRSTPATAGVES